MVKSLGFNQLKKNLKKDYTQLKIIKLAILADSAVQLFAQAMKGYGYETGINLDILEVSSDKIDGFICDKNSSLYRFKPDYVVIFHSAQKLLDTFYYHSKNEQQNFVSNYLGSVNDLYLTITKQLPAKVIYCNIAEVDDGLFGNYSNKTTSSFLYQIRKINLGLMDFASVHSNLFICDLATLASQHGDDFTYQNSIYINADMVFSLDFFAIFSKYIMDIIQVTRGKLIKCIIFDLDNTIWGGQIGDDGIEGIQIGNLGIGKAFREFQLWLKQLKKRGILLVVCSKNSEEIAKQPFKTHPEMILREEDIALFIANWGNKVENISQIQQTLNIGFDSIVFLDDNLFERTFVRKYFPEMIVPALPEDPANYLSYLRRLNLFGITALSDEDETRTQLYQQETRRLDLKRSFVNEDEFLESLDMTAKVEPFNNFYVPRLAQLSQRSNQFNLRTIRYSNMDIERMIQDNNYVTLSILLKDNLGDYGLISMLTLQKNITTLFIENWIMSCRVLKRGVENFALNHIVNMAQKMGAKKILGQYIPTLKNSLVKDHYHNLGFRATKDRWVLRVKDYQPKATFIKYEKRTDPF